MSLASIRHPNLDFSEASIPTEVAELAIGAIRSDATTPEELSLGHFTVQHPEPQPILMFVFTLKNSRPISGTVYSM